jgi:hypothetical protein
VIWTFHTAMAIIWPPKRGDLVQTNVGDRRERTWFVIKARHLNRSQSPFPRYELWTVRWWEIDPETRQALFRSAERHGGQQVLQYRNEPLKQKAKKKYSFEEYMQR